MSFYSSYNFLCEFQAALHCGSPFPMFKIHTEKLDGNPANVRLPQVHYRPFPPELTYQYINKDVWLITDFHLCEYQQLKVVFCDISNYAFSEGHKSKVVFILFPSE